MIVIEFIPQISGEVTKQDLFNPLESLFDAIKIAEFWVLFNQFETAMKMDNSNLLQSYFFGLSQELRTINKDTEFEKHLANDIGLHIHIERSCLTGIRP